jgi:hypothetical protein
MTAEQRREWLDELRDLVWEGKDFSSFLANGPPGEIRLKYWIASCIGQSV